MKTPRPLSLRFWGGSAMSERQKNKILAVYLILVNAGVNVSDSLKKAVEGIERERISRKVAAV